MVNKQHILRPLCVIYALWICWSGTLHAQVLINSIQVDPQAVSETTLFSVGLTNTGSSTSVTLRGELQELAGMVVLKFQSESFICAVGTMQVPVGTLRMRTFQYANSSTANTARQQHRLPAGRYMFCIEVLEGGEVADRTCEPITAEDLITLDLVHPWDGDSIEETRPALTWMATGTFPGISIKNTRLVLVPLADKRSAQQALASERPLFMVNEPDRTMHYPVGIPELELGKCYAWQVERVENGRVLDRSEAWRFCVKKTVAPVPMKYVRLEEVQPGTVYEVVDGRIYFRYDEPYASSSMRCTIISDDHQVIEPTLTNESASTHSSNGRTVGANHFDLDLTPYSLKPGTYDLRVTDGKGEGRTLRFRIPR